MSELTERVQKLLDSLLPDHRYLYAQEICAVEHALRSLSAPEREGDSPDAAAPEGEKE